MSSISRCTLAAMLALLAVASASAVLAAQDGAQDLVLNGFTLAPPSGWDRQQRPAAVAFGKLVDEQPAPSVDRMPRQTFMILVKMEKAPVESLASAAALERYVLDRILVASRDRRQLVVSRDTEPFTLQGTDCIRFRMVLEEKPRSDVLLITGAGVFCRHPNAPGHAVHASYSERHVKGDDVAPADAEIAAAEAVLGSLTFTPVR